MKNNQKISTLTIVVQMVFFSAAASAEELNPLARSPLYSSPYLLAQSGGDSLLSKDELFGDDIEDTKVPLTPGRQVSSAKGFVQAEIARTYAAPSHWSKMRFRADISKTGALSESVKYRLGARLGVDAAYSGERDYYPAEVRRDQRSEAELRENYLDISAGALDLRLGKQHVIWGEMVGLYFADVVSARDMTEFILQDFEAQRIPQWAARAEYFAGDLHGELLWVPVPSYDRLGKPGSDFYPVQVAPLGAVTVYRDEVKPDRKLSNTNYGLRFSGLVSGWDLSAFFYRSLDVAQTFSRQIAAPATFIFEPRHERITQVGGALTKDFGAMVLKSEVVHTQGRQFTVVRASDADGLAASDTIDWALGLDFTPLDDIRLNTQVFQRIFREHDPDMLTKPRETGYSLYLTAKFTNHIEAQLLWISSFDREDWLARPKLVWNFEKNWRAILGADVFKGPQFGLFGQFDNRDRVYSELRYSF